MRERIAIVGSGVSGHGGLRYRSAHHDVTVFDRDARPGGHAHTIDVAEPGTGRALPMDTGFMVFNEVTYPHLCRLFKELGVKPKKTSMSFAVRHDPTGLEWRGSSLDHLFAQRRNLLRPRFWKLLWQINRFNGLAKSGWRSPEAETTSLRDWCARKGLGRDFLDLYLIPMSAAVWSTPADKMLGFPAAALMRFFHNHGFLGLDTQHQWLTLEGGSRTYVQALLRAHPADFRFGQGVTSVRRDGAQVVVATDAGEERFDRVIMASHADTTLRLLADADAEERRLLGPFAYNRNDAIVHTDLAPLPRTPRARSSWNYRTWAKDGALVTSTHYWMNSLQGLTDRGDFVVTINHADQVDPAKVLRVIPTEHPLFSLEAVAAQAEIPALNARPGARTHFAGAWQRYGFHEDGLWSAHRLCSQLLGRDAWEA
ncbi:MAG: NAD(P)/FAD-dependent oxidoreductase [Verrucomicrobiota bacterium]